MKTAPESEAWYFLKVALCAAYSVTIPKPNTANPKSFSHPKNVFCAASARKPAPKMRLILKTRDAFIGKDAYGAEFAPKPVRLKGCV